MENIIREVQAYLDQMTQEEFDKLLDKYGNQNGTPGPMFMKREDFKKKSSQIIGKYNFNIKNECEGQNELFFVTINKPYRVIPQDSLKFEVKTNECDMIA